MAESNSEADTEESRAVRETTAGAPLPPGVVRDGGGDAVTADETREIETPDQTFSSDDDSSDVSQEGAIAPAQGDHDDGNEKEEGIDSPAVSESSTALAAESPEFTTITRANSLPPSQSTSAMHQMLEREFSRKEGGKEGGKGAFLLHRIGVRKNSFTESAPPSSVAALSSPMLDGGSGSSDTSIVRSQSTQRSTGSGGPHHKLSKRSTKLLGKFVPKFLQTSFSPSLSTPGGGVGGNTSPHLQTAGVSPLSSRSSRSGSISGQSGQSDTAGSSIGAGGSSAPSSNKSSRESLTLDVIHDTESLSPGYTRMDATSPQYLELLRSDTHINPSLMARRSSCSSATSKMSGNSLGSKPSASSMSSFDPSESNEYRRNSGSGSTKGGDGMCAFEVEYDDEDSEEDHGDEETSMTVDGDHEAATNTAETDDPPISPYIIDDDCDDDFFLNSVLRKKPSVPSFSPTMAMMASSYPSSTTISSIHSSARTPSLSGWSSSSSQASTPSPTSPLLLNGQVYSFPVTHSSSNNGYRSNNPLPPAINFGQDEKRSRLRDAVGEWRRSAIASNQL
ncbi:hypothetical protein BGX29_010718 [Mortierella sp. GBA35]|nr:hypothetical protein BGX29_010718 [Mortierella sp. GBA35]